MTHPNRRPDDPVSKDEASERYVFAIDHEDEKLAELHELLTVDVDLMGVLYLLYLDLGWEALYERTEPESVIEARARGWIAGTRPHLTRDGLMAFWDWKLQVTPHLRDARFQSLWRDVTAW